MKLKELQGRLRHLLSTNIAMFNEKLRARNLSTIMVQPPRKPTSEP